MPAPYEFSPYHNPQADQTIASLLQDQGRIQADATRASGNAWAGAIQNIGQTVAQIPQQIQQQKRQQLQDAATTAQTAALQAETKVRIDKEQQDAYIDQAMKGSLVPDPETGAAKIDRQKFEQNLIASGQGHLYKEWQPTLDALEDKAAQRASVSRSLWAHTLVGIHKGGDTPQSMLSAMAFLKANHAITDEAFTAAQTQLAQDASPVAIKNFVDTIGARIPEYADVSAAYQKQQVEAAKVQAETAKTAAETKKTEAEVAGTLPMTPAQKAEAAARSATLKLEADRLQETRRHNSATEAAANPLAALTGNPQAGTAAAPQGPTGDEFLKTIPPNIASEVKAYAEGRRPFPSGMALKSPYFQTLIQMVGQYDPTFDAANYNARNKARTDLTSPSGTGGKTINALNTALQHAGKLSDLIEKLDNYGSPVANAVVNPFRTATGSTAVTNYQAVAPQLAKEIERAWRGAGGSTKDIEDLINSIGKNLGKQQQREALNQFVDLVKGKLDATQTQRDTIMGPAGQSIPILYDQNKPIIEKIQQRASGQGYAVGQTVTLSDGKSVTIKKINTDGTFEY